MSSRPPAIPLRLAGRAILDDGALFVWSMAEGRRGRRWRASAIRDGVLSHVLLLELGGQGELARLELSTSAGLLTLHPASDLRTIHGNVVGREGVRPLQFPWSTDHAIEIVGRPLATAAMLHRLATEVGVGEHRTVPVLAIEPDMSVLPGERRVERLADGWLVSGGGRELRLALRSDGIPEFPEATMWPLEEEITGRSR